VHVYLWVGPVWLLLLSLLFLYQHFQERSSCGASYPLAVFLFLRPRFGTLRCCAPRVWICTVYSQSLVWRLGLAKGAVARQEPVS
jgi:hypothetical protein